MNAQLATIKPEQVQAWTEDDVKAVKDQIAKDANPQEFKLFIYTATQRGLNPLLKQIYCIHRSGRMTIQTSIDGYRLIAQRTGKLAGIERGVKYDNEGKLSHGWARVHRKDWDHPVYEEVPFKEYTSGQNNWAKMPETMIKKVAEAAALRMAFPEDLSGLYTQDEMDQADKPNSIVTQEELQPALEEAKKRDAKEAKSIMSQIKKLQTEHMLTDTDVSEITGIETFRGITDVKQLQIALMNLMDHIEKDAAFAVVQQEVETQKEIAL